MSNIHHQPLGAQPGNDNAATDSPFLDEKRLCAELAISSVTATKWRAQAKGPPFIKVGRLVRYRRIRELHRRHRSSPFAWFL